MAALKYNVELIEDEQIRTAVLKLACAQKSVARKEFIRKIGVIALHDIALYDLCNGCAPYLFRRVSGFCSGLYEIYMFLYDSGIVQSEFFRRLKLLEGRFEVNSRPQNYEYLAEYKFFDEFVSKIGIDTRRKRQILFAMLPTDGFIDDRVKNAALAVFEQEKLRARQNTEAILNELYITRLMLLEVFKSVSLKGITREYIYDNYMRLMSGNTTENRVGCRLASLLVSMRDNGGIVDRNLLEVCRVLETYTLVTNRILVKLLTCDYPEYYFSFVAYFRPNKKGVGYDFFQSPVQEIRNAYKKFREFKGSLSIPSVVATQGAASFTDALCGLPVESLGDLTIETLIKQAKYYQEHKYPKKTVPWLFSFYRFLHQEYNLDLSKNSQIDERFLSGKLCASALEKGFSIEIYNPMDPIPTSDKWLLFYGDTQWNNSAVKASATVRIDFTRIANHFYRRLVKVYMWLGVNSSLITRVHEFLHLEMFTNYISDLKSGKELSIFVTPSRASSNDDSRYTITANDVIAYKAYITSLYSKNATIMGCIYDARTFLKFLLDNEICEVDAGALYYLTYVRDVSQNSAEAIPDNILEILAAILREQSSISKNYALYELIFYIALETEFRASQILALKEDCVKEVGKKGQYVVISPTKVSHKDVVEQAITEYTKREIDEVRKITQSSREACTTRSMKDFLFIRPSNVLDNAFELITQGEFNRYLKLCCDRAGCKKYTLQNLRDTHITKAREYVIRNNKSRLEQLVLTGHSSVRTDEAFYVEQNLRDMIEAVYGIIIGNVTIEGEVVKKIPESISIPDNEVSDGCGFCKASACRDMSFVDCLLCKEFVTGPDREYFFQNAIVRIEERIRKTTVPHDKEDFVNIKRLFVAYLLEIQKCREGINESGSKVQ